MLEGKNIRVWCGRSDLIGDTVMALPMLHFLEHSFPDSYKYWSILRKCSQAAPLYLNHPLIDKVVVSDFDEGFGENDAAVFESCGIRIPTRPQHKYNDWYNKYSMLKETWLMAGLKEVDFDNMSESERTPKLYPWWQGADKNMAIVVHCFAGYGRDNHRSPSKAWWERMITQLVNDGNKVIRVGHPNEPVFFIDRKNCVKYGPQDGFDDYRGLSFLEQVQLSVSSRAYIGTDSGFSLVMGAYSHPQVTLLTNWNVGHTHNPLSLQPINRNNISLFNKIDDGGCSGISQEKVLESLYMLL